MASPSIRGQTAPVSGGTTTSPAGTQVGDLVIVFTWERSAASIGASTLSVNSGGSFQNIRNHHHDDGTTDGSLGVAYKVATQAGAQSYQGFTSSTGSPAWWTGCTVLQAGTYDVASIVSAGVTQTNNAVPNPPAASGLTSSRDYLVLAIAAWHLGSSVTNTATAPTNYTNLVQLAGSATGDLACASRAISGATSEDPGTYGDDQAPNGTCAITIAIANLAVRTGTLTATDPVDTASVAGDVFVSGSLSVTDAADTASLAGDVIVAGTLAATDAIDTASADGDVLVSGTLEATDAPDTFAAEGEVTASAITGDLAATDVADSATASGTVLVSGALAASDAPDTASAEGDVFVAGTLAANDVPDTAAADGGVVVAGELAATDAGDTATAAGAVLVDGELAATDAVDTALFTAANVTQGSMAATDTGDSFEGAGLVVISGTWLSVEDPDVAGAMGHVLVSGALIGADSPDIARFVSGSGEPPPWVPLPVILSGRVIQPVVKRGRVLPPGA